MRTCFLDKKSQEILGEENYPIDEANRIVAMNPESISKDMGEVFKYLCTNANNKIEFVEAPYLNTKQIRQYTDEMEKDPKINFCPLTLLCTKQKKVIIAYKHTWQDLKMQRCNYKQENFR